MVDENTYETKTYVMGMTFVESTNPVIWAFNDNKIMYNNIQK